MHRHIIDSVHRHRKGDDENNGIQRKRKSRILSGKWTVQGSASMAETRLGIRSWQRVRVRRPLHVPEVPMAAQRVVG